MERYIVLDTKTNEVIYANQVEFPCPTEGGSTQHGSLYKAIQEVREALDDLESREEALDRAMDY